MKCVKNLRVIKKNTALATLAFIMTAFNFIALVFTVARGEIEFLSGKESFYSNGFTFIFKGYPPIVEGCGDVLRATLVIYFALSVLLAVWLGVYCAVKRSVNLGKLATFAVIFSLVLSVLYAVVGIVAYSSASDFANLYYECSTAGFLPFVFSAVISVCYFMVRGKMPEVIELPLENRKK